ncbi:hypothetical protein A3757_11855 [Oleiphilus sp. HI0117]|nr:hypothetical protein A3732_03345 [Oleiphilus sp. HI0050]KZZ31022.1 hypothetical protein A3756_22195 [Oleiphilus sp. HI0086]KZZ34269.1 hypothetical protein A3756_03435 [Oleiphilus sp. HI0086]KZZ37294.1 hypothetical protein A3757_11855 [Oleiphilus sp. HI0117]KZZ57853.1 hypothetical protein A3761_06445 [Oleiphilus sp. HI0123]
MQMDLDERESLAALQTYFWLFHAIASPFLGFIFVTHVFLRGLCLIAQDTFVLHLPALNINR